MQDLFEIENHKPQTKHSRSIEMFLCKLVHETLKNGYLKTGTLVNSEVEMNCNFIRKMSRVVFRKRNRNIILFGNV